MSLVTPFQDLSLVSPINELVSSYGNANEPRYVSAGGHWPSLYWLLPPNIFTLVVAMSSQLYTHWKIINIGMYSFLHILQCKWCKWEQRWRGSKKLLSVQRRSSRLFALTWTCPWELGAVVSLTVWLNVPETFQQNIIILLTHHKPPGTWHLALVNTSVSTRAATPSSHWYS